MKFSKTLTHWYSVNKRNLPWRETKNPYFIWLSEIILQQTQVAQGLPYYVKFTTNFPTIFDLARADEDVILKYWQGLGYYSRARNLHATSKYIVKELNGVFPNTYSEIIKLKGVGDYTASAVSSICFNEATAVVDGNVYRALSRYFGIDTPINTSKGFKEFKALAQELINKQDPAQFNQAIMEFGARQCKPKNPDCNVCPFNDSCIALQKKKVSLLPVKLKTTKVTKKYFNFIVLLSIDGMTLLEQRQGKGIWQNLYQFPLVESDGPLKIEELKETIKTLDFLKNQYYTVSLYNDTDILHKLSHQHLFTKFWILKSKTSFKEGISVNEIIKYPVPKLIANFIEEFNF